MRTIDNPDTRVSSGRISHSVVLRESDHCNAAVADDRPDRPLVSLLPDVVYVAGTFRRTRTSGHARESVKYQRTVSICSAPLRR